MEEAQWRSLVEKFLSNECTSIEANTVADSIENDYTILDSIRIFENVEDSDVVQTDISFKASVLRRILKNPKSSVKLYILRVAAILIGFCILYWFMVDNKFSLKKENRVVEDIKVTNHTLTIEAHLLPDSSIVWLTPNTTIKYNTEFVENRKIWLVNGNAYFKVYHNKKPCFSVFSSNLKITATGTQFWVQQLTNQNKLSVSLIEGNVYINPANDKIKFDTVYLKANQICYIDLGTGKTEISNATQSTSKGSNIPYKGHLLQSAHSSILWSNKEIQFFNASLKSVLLKLESIHAVHFYATDSSILNSNITGTIFYSDSLSTIVKSICDLKKLTYEERGDTIFLNSKN